MKPMTNLLQSVSKYIFVLIHVLAVYLFFKGHNEPGGGFIAGLASSISFILIAMSGGTTLAKRILIINPLTFAGIGLFLAYFTSLAPTLVGLPFIFHKMIHLTLPIWGDVHIGTPALFDLGVYMVVIGVTSKAMFILSDELDQSETKGDAA